jgi:hypothetical protein
MAAWHCSARVGENSAANCGFLMEGRGWHRDIAEALGLSKATIT